MTPNQPDSDPGAHVREQVRGIITAEDLACLGVKVRPPIPVSDEERVALGEAPAPGRRRARTEAT